MTEQVRRASRLIEIEHRLRQNPRGLTVRELSEQLGFSTRTLQRDILVLQSELGVPLTDNYGRRYRILPGSSPIGAVRLNLQEARALYLAARLFLRLADERDPDGIAALEKLEGALPPGLARHVRHTAEELRARPQNDAQAEILRALTTAWVDGRTVAINYASARQKRPIGVDPYLIEPARDGSGVYLFGYSHEHGEIRTFKVDRVSRVKVLDVGFEPPDLTETWEQVAQSWNGAVLGNEDHDIELVFSPAVAKRVKERHWHPTEVREDLPDGSLRMCLHLQSLLEFAPWVRSWGPEVEVIGPPELREEIASSLRAAAARYS